MQQRHDSLDMTAIRNYALLFSPGWQSRSNTVNPG
jgi:hypothetical protein